MQKRDDFLGSIVLSMFFCVFCCDVFYCILDGFVGAFIAFLMALLGHLQGEHIEETCDKVWPIQSWEMGRLGRKEPKPSMK